MFVVDASVACKYALNEPGTDAAEALLFGSESLLAPHYFFVETAQVLWRAVRRQRLSRAGFDESFSNIRSLPLTITDDSSLIEPAINIALHHDISVHDALYVALARSRNSEFATCDDALCAKLRRAKLPELRYTLI
jgi:predicted nucleic acid-binding protein